MSELELIIAVSGIVVVVFTLLLLVDGCVREWLITRRPTREGDHFQVSVGHNEGVHEG